MSHICDICEKEPGAHSFTYLFRTKKPNIYEYLFYTCIGDSKKTNEQDKVIKHYDLTLRTMNPDKWIWVFNCDGFSLKHYAEINTIIKIAEIIRNFGRVEAIYIVNAPTLFNLVLPIIKPILDTETYCKFKITSPEDTINLINLEKNDSIRLKKLLNKNLN